MCCSALQCVTVCRRVTHTASQVLIVGVLCVAVCCSVLQCVAVCCSALQCVAVCCRVTHTASSLTRYTVWCSVFSVLQRVKVLGVGIPCRSKLPSWSRWSSTVPGTCAVLVDGVLERAVLWLPHCACRGGRSPPRCRGRNESISSRPGAIDRLFFCSATRSVDL